MKLLCIDGKLPIKIGAFFVSIFMIATLLPTFTAGAAGGDDVTLTVTINNTTSGKIYGPDNVVLKFTGNISDKANSTPMYIGNDIAPSDVITQTNSETSRSEDSSLILRATFVNVPAGKYKVCYETPNTACSSEFEKISGIPASANIVLGATDIAALPSVTNSSSVSKTSCAIEGVGWILCPIMNVMGKMVDGAYWFVEQLLITPAVNTNINDQNNGTYQAWSIMRSFANIAFVIAFLIIIFSQLTNVGINNYGIKKMLPRLIIAAILVNVSYYVCAIAVDLSNIIGSSTKGLFDNITTQITATDGKDNFSWISVVALAIGGGLVYTGGFTLYGALLLLLPALISALFAIFAVFLVLTLRQALIILLIVISPLAFVAFLLPNTSVLFNKWLDLFKTMLLMFPIIAVIFGASALASKVIMGSSDSFPVQLMGALVAIIPLAITPVVMKSAGNILNKFGAIVNNPNKGIFDNMKNAVEREKAREANRTNNAAMNSKGGIFSRNAGRRAFLRYGARKNAIDENQQREKTRSTTEYIANATQGNEMTAAQSVLAKASLGKLGGKGFAEKMAAGGAEGAENRARASAVSVADRLFEDNVAASSAMLKGKSFPDVMSMATNASTPEADRVAAIREIMRTGNYDERREVIATSGTATLRGRTSVQDGFYKAGDQKIFGSAFGGQILSGNVKGAGDLDTLLLGRIGAGNIAAENIVDDKLIRHIQELKDRGLLTGEGLVKIREVVKKAYESTTIRDKITTDIGNKLQYLVSGDGYNATQNAQTNQNSNNSDRNTTSGSVEVPHDKLQNNQPNNEMSDDIKYDFFDSRDNPNSPNYDPNRKR